MSERSGVQKYRFLSHVADVLFEAKGKSFAEALENAADAFFSVVADTKKVRATKKVSIKEKAASREELASFVLSDLLTQADIKQLFFKKFKVKKIVEKGGAFHLHGTAFGSAMKPELGKIYVKAVTLHETRVEEKKGEWTIRILLDI